MVLHETNLSMFALLSVDREEGNLAIVHRESVPGGGYRSVHCSVNTQQNTKYKLSLAEEIQRKASYICYFYETLGIY